MLFISDKMSKKILKSFRFTCSRKSNSTRIMVGATKIPIDGVNQFVFTFRKGAFYDCS